MIHDRVFFTIAIPTYNNANLLEKVISSCANQEYSGNFEVIVVDNASNDNTRETVAVLKQNFDSLHYFANEVTCSQFENHNKCLEHANGEFVLFCHTDDQLLPNALDYLNSRIQQRNKPNRYILWGHSLFRDFSPSLESSNIPIGMPFSGVYAIRAFLDGGLTPSGICYSKSFLDIGGFLKPNEMLSVSDSTSMIRACFEFFQFEMCEAVIFNRSIATISGGANFSREHQIGMYDAWSTFSEELEINQMTQILIQMRLVKKINVVIYDVFCDYIPNIVIKRFLQKLYFQPGLVLKPSVLFMFLKLIIRCLSVSKKRFK